MIPNVRIRATLQKKEEGVLYLKHAVRATQGLFDPLKGHLGDLTVSEKEVWDPHPDTLEEGTIVDLELDGWWYYRVREHE